MQLHSQIPRQVRSKQGFFEQKVKDFWSEPTHLNNRFHGAVIGPFWQNFYVLVMFPRMKKPDTFSPLDEKILKSVWQL